MIWDSIFKKTRLWPQMRKVVADQLHCLIFFTAYLLQRMRTLCFIHTLMNLAAKVCPEAFPIGERATEFTKLCPAAFTVYGAGVMKTYYTAIL